MIWTSAKAACGTATMRSTADYVCDMDMDEDEAARLMAVGARDCPYWRPGDEYRTARKQ